MADLSKEEIAALSRIADLDDPQKLRALAANAKRLNSSAVERAAFERLCTVIPEEMPGSFTHDFWKSIIALEEMLTAERGRTTRLNRLRPKIDRVGERKALVDLVMPSKPSEGFFMLIERGYPELTAEAVVLRHRGDFDELIVAAAESRLSEATISSQNGSGESHG